MIIKSDHQIQFLKSFSFPEKSSNGFPNLWLPSSNGSSRKILPVFNEQGTNFMKRYQNSEFLRLNVLTNSNNNKLHTYNHDFNAFFPSNVLNFSFFFLRSVSTSLLIGLMIVPVLVMTFGKTSLRWALSGMKVLLIGAPMDAWKSFTLLKGNGSSLTWKTKTNFSVQQIVTRHSNEF